MRVKTFSALTTAQAMDLVRDELGDEAIIVSTRTEQDGSTLVTAAIDPAIPTDDAANEDFEAPEPLIFPGETEATVRQALTYHGVPPWLTNRLAKRATTAEVEAEAESTAASLSFALAGHFSFSSLDDEWPSGPIILVGPPGVGKTVTAAKLCAREHMAKRPVGVVSTDTKRAGGIEQLAAFTRILNLKLRTASNPSELIDAHEGIVGPGGRVIIDTPATNPFDEEDMAVLKEYISAVKAEPVLVIAAGGDPMEAADAAQAYVELGATRMIATRMDLARRFGGLLAAADGAGLSMAEASISPQVAEGLVAMTADTLARLMMPHAETPAENPKTTEA